MLQSDNLLQSLRLSVSEEAEGDRGDSVRKLDCRRCGIYHREMKHASMSSKDLVDEDRG